MEGAPDQHIKLEVDLPLPSELAAPHEEDDSSEDDGSGVPRHLRVIYQDVITSHNPFLLSSEQLKFAGDDPKFWELRRVLVEKLNRDLNEELVFLQHLFEYDTKDDLKWQHRQWIAEKLGSNARIKELEFADKIIQKDPNNYRAWSYRQWVFQAFGGDWEDELAYCDKILEKDAFVRVAWDQRYFVVKTSMATVAQFEAMRFNEVDYSLKAIAANPGNECPWKYLRSLYRRDLKSLVGNFQLRSACLTILKNERDHVNVVKDHLMFGIAKPHALYSDAVVNKKACCYALGMVSDMIKLGFISGDELDTFRCLEKFCENGDVEPLVTLTSPIEK